MYGAEEDELTVLLLRRVAVKALMTFPATSTQKTNKEKQKAASILVVSLYVVNTYQRLLRSTFRKQTIYGTTFTHSVIPYTVSILDVRKSQLFDTLTELHIQKKDTNS